MRIPITDIVPGTRLDDTSCGPCTATDRPRHVAGGYVVDVKSILWHGGELHWTAACENLRRAAQ